MFSLEAPPGKHGKRKHGSIALASLTDSLHLQPAVWRSSKVQVAAPRMSARRVPRQQLKVVPTSESGPPAFLLHQHKRAVQAALGVREEVSRFLLADPLHLPTVPEMSATGCISLLKGLMLLLLIEPPPAPAQSVHGICHAGQLLCALHQCTLQQQDCCLWSSSTK